MLAGKRCRLGAPAQRTTRTGNLVGRDLLAIARAAEHDAQAAGVSDGLQRSRDAERRVVVLGVICIRAAVDWLVPALPSGG